MRKMIAAIFAVVLLSAAPSQALMIGQMRSAETSGWGSLNLTTGIGIFDNVKHIFGTVRYGIASQVDISGSLALLDHEANDDASLLLNADVQYQFMQSKLGYSFDMAAGAVFEYFSMGYGNVDASTWTIGLNYIVSKPVKLENGFAFTPYGRLNVRSDNYSAETEVVELGVPGTTSRLSKLLNSQATVSSDESDFNIGVNLGSVFPISSKISLTGEVQIDDEVGFLGGITFFMW
ncbi:MAG: hypothetical protein IPH59_04020 [bacterium]|nr:hypothetical protein [bacterium]